MLCSRSIFFFSLILKSDNEMEVRKSMHRASVVDLVSPQPSCPDTEERETAKEGEMAQVVRLSRCSFESCIPETPSPIGCVPGINDTRNEHHSRGACDGDKAGGAVSADNHTGLRNGCWSSPRLQCHMTGLPVNDKLVHKLQNCAQVTVSTLRNVLHSKFGLPLDKVNMERSKESLIVEYYAALTGAADPTRKMTLHPCDEVHTPDCQSTFGCGSLAEESADSEIELLHDTLSLPSQTTASHGDSIDGGNMATKRIAIEQDSESDIEDLTSRPLWERTEARLKHKHGGGVRAAVEHAKHGERPVACAPATAHTQLPEHALRIETIRGRGGAEEEKRGGQGGVEAGEENARKLQGGVVSLSSVSGQLEGCGLTRSTTERQGGGRRKRAETSEKTRFRSPEAQKRQACTSEGERGRHGAKEDDADVDEPLWQRLEVRVMLKGQQRDLRGEERKEDRRGGGHALGGVKEWEDEEEEDVFESRKVGRTLGLSSRSL